MVVNPMDGHVFTIVSPGNPHRRINSSRYLFVLQIISTLRWTTTVLPFNNIIKRYDCIGWRGTRTDDHYNMTQRRMVIESFLGLNSSTYKSSRVRLERENVVSKYLAHLGVFFLFEMIFTENIDEFLPTIKSNN